MRKKKKSDLLRSGRVDVWAANGSFGWLGKHGGRVVRADNALDLKRAVSSESGEVKLGGGEQRPPLKVNLMYEKMGKGKMPG